ncbi:MAG: patatin-like phospholipase family protein [Bacteroidaceae bacterium]
MKTPEIAICLSGGGYRAATFHLGTLSYLHHLHLDNGDNFLNIVNTMSTISGGTITGLWYMMSLCKGIDEDEAFKNLYQILIAEDIPVTALKEFVQNQKTVHSLIKQMAEVYDEKFFKGECFKLFLDNIDKVHVHHFSANGTDFSNGLAFRYQATQEIKNAGKGSRHGIIGNYQNQIPEKIATQIRLAEILATSSCFPGGFEPLIFPTDFKLATKKENQEYIAATTPIGLMDGGIVDNQGVGPITLAEKQMELDNKNSSNGNSIDLIIISDVASPYMAPYEYKPANIFTKLSLKKLTHLGYGLTTLLCMATIITAIFGSAFWTGVLFALSCISIIHSGVIRYIIYRVNKGLDATPLSKCKNEVKHVTLNSVINLVKSRVSCMLILANSVFLKHIRRLTYSTIYKDDKWKNRRIMNAIYELRDHEKWEEYAKSGTLPKNLIPSNAIQKNSRKAANMATTLWFTDKDKASGTPEAIIAAGQYNICWNLLVYIKKLKESIENTNETHQLILKCEQQLLDDWEKFQKNPMWLFNDQMK